MTQFSAIVTCYEEILVLSGRMLEAAQAADWDTVTELQRSYLALVENLRQLDHEAPFSDAERMRRYQLLDRILTYDARIRDLAMPQLQKVGAMLTSSRRQFDLSAAYGAMA
ncbi:Flagellar protein FliT [Cupriavidus yeoncheonensis]|uniref:Flagellar protein FliT n=1 Tax=Cupriavidus yeoncheonensis TaxID=1462994 RepID=A0A916IZV5_9BURK|nr:flagellar protein FliT [Cupriavidus yeoncheonensis]CAG2154519.1 Flagellar protein FliT [Cupriavidus yeoncheonensis]